MPHIFATHDFPLCRLCHKRVPLESCNTDEDGHAVHEECYVTHLSAKEFAPRLVT